MKLMELIRLLNSLPDEYDNQQVYVNLKKSDYKPNDEEMAMYDPELYCSMMAMYDPELYCNMLQITLDFEDDCIVITGEL